MTPTPTPKDYATVTACIVGEKRGDAFVVDYEATVQKLVQAFATFRRGHPTMTPEPTEEDFETADDFLCRWYITMDSTRAEDDIRIDLAQALATVRQEAAPTPDAALLASDAELQRVCESLPHYVASEDSPAESVKGLVQARERDAALLAECRTVLTDADEELYAYEESCGQTAYMRRHIQELLTRLPHSEERTP